MAYIDNVTNILQIQPDGLPTFVRLSQNENGRNLYFQLAGNEIDIPANATITISGTKPDGTVYSGTGSISNNVILIPEMIQMTAVAGYWDAKVKIISGGNTIATGRIRFVIDADTVDPDSVPSDSELEGLVAEAQQYAETARTEAYGSPLTATTAAGMTDHTRVYVYTGSETGYTAGHWYYWDGTQWTDGGIYNSTAVNTDPTLTLAGVAADAKATGDAIEAARVAIDDTLTNEGEAADAAAVGSEISGLKEDLRQIDKDVYGDQVVITYVPNEYVANDGSFTPYNNWSRTDFIPIPNDGDGMRYTNDGRATSYCAWYSDKSESSFIRMFSAQKTQTGNAQIPESAKYFVVSNYTADIEMFNYINPPSSDSGLVTTVEGLDDRVTALESSQGSVPEIVLPPYAVAVVGHEFNMYTENVVICKNLNDYIWAWNMRPYATQYNQYDDRFSVIPATGSERTYTLSLTCADKITGVTLTSASMSLIVVSDSALTGKKMLMIGDSLTAAGYSAYEIASVLSAGGVESLGTITANPWIGNVQKPITMEGRGGWNAYDYMHTASKNGNTNAFLNPSTNLFDFSYYMTQQGYSNVDIVMLNLGTNGVENIQRDIEAMGQIIASIHSYNANIPVVVHLTPPPATQNGWTYINHGAGAEEFRLKTLALVKAQIEAFGNKQAEKTYISCVYGCLDRHHDFAYREEAVSQRNPFVVTRQIQNVHPASYGYYKFADVYWGMIEYLLT